jgi:hypothetical protein
VTTRHWAPQLIYINVGALQPANFLLAKPLDQPLHALAPGDRPPPGWLKAIDFGCAQQLNGDKPLTRRTGTPVYMVRISDTAAIVLALLFLRKRFANMPCALLRPRAAGHCQVGGVYQHPVVSQHDAIWIQA